MLIPRDPSPVPALRPWLRAVLVAAACTMAGHASAGAGDFRDLDWLELLPERDRLALENQGPIEHGNERVPSRQPALGAGRSGPSADEVARAWQSTNVVGELDGETVRLPGFVVPLAYDERKRVTEFFLVPFFGACIHVPPPPPNQIVYVPIPEGVAIPSIYDPYVVEGTLSIDTTHREIGISAYALAPEGIRRYRR